MNAHQLRQPGFKLQLHVFFVGFVNIDIQAVEIDLQTQFYSILITIWNNQGATQE